MSSPRIAVVTGGNKGIGYAIVTELCRKFDGIVYLTARNPDLGKEAVANLKKDGLNARFHQLNIDDQSSIDALAQDLKKEHGGLDVLVNNAAIAYKGASTAPFSEQAENTIKTNYFSNLNVCKALFPLLKPHARVVNFSSSEGMLTKIPDEKMRSRFAYADLKESELNGLMEEFVNDAKNGTVNNKGWAPSAYGMSKIGITALTMIQQREFDKDPREDIIVNAVHPGYVNTDMSSHRGVLSPSEGAVAPMYLALLPPNANSPKGQMVWNDKTIKQWLPDPLPSRN